jgi:prevent-host-death family protein
MQTVTAEFAAEHLAELIHRAQDGAEIVITVDGSPVVRLLAVQPGEADESHAPDEEVDAAFHGD